MEIRLGPADLGPLIDLVDDPVAGVPESALTALANLPLEPEAWRRISPKVNLLLDDLETPSISVEPRSPQLATDVVLRCAVRVPDNQVRQRVRMLTTSQDLVTRRAAARALAGVCDPAAVPQLLDDLKGVDNATRSTAINGLVFAETPTLNLEAASSLSQAARCQNLAPLSRLNAAIVLARQGKPRVLLRLLKLLRRDAGSIFPGAPPDLSFLRELEPPPKHVQVNLARFTQDDDPRDLAREIAESLLATPSGQRDRSAPRVVFTPDAAAAAEAKRLAMTYITNDVDEDWSHRLERDVDALASAAPGIAEELVADVFRRIAERSPTHREVQAGNAAVELVSRLKGGIQPDLGKFFPTYKLLTNISPSAADQLAWTVSRAKMPKLVADLGRILPSIPDVDRAMLVNLVGRAARFASTDDPPMFGAGPAALATPRSFEVIGDRGGGDPPIEEGIGLEENLRETSPPTRRVRVGVVATDPPENATNADVLPKTEPLAVGKAYFLRIDISAEAGGTNVVNEKPIPAQALERIPAGEGLDVVVSSRDFEIPDGGPHGGQQTISLTPGSASTFAYVQLTAPVQPGLARLRICVYFRNSLLQWLETTARVVSEAEPGEVVADEVAGNETRIVYTISPRMASFEDYDQVAVNIVFDTSRRDVDVKGDGEAPRQFSNISGSIEQFRDAMTLISKDDGAYRFQPYNQGDARELPGQLLKLADLGRSLFNVLFTEPTKAFLRRELDESAVIEIARRSSDHSVPWSAIYDLPLKEANIAQLEGAPLETCMLWTKDDHQLPAPDPHGHEELVPNAAHCSSQPDCPLRPLTDESATEFEDRQKRHVCVFGFWGFKHRLQQPAGKFLDDEQSEPNPLQQVIRFPDRPRVSVIGNPEIAYYPTPHKDRIQALSERSWHPEIHPADNFAEIKTELRVPDSHVIYFYCHGDTQGSFPVLKVGGNPSFALSTNTFADWCKRWPNGPLVFVNGCETVSYSSESLTNLAIWLRGLNAAGVIGTEIEVFPELAQWFGEQFLTWFLDGWSVGDVMLRLRLGLLAKKNPLGLVYTNHTLAGLKLQKQ